MRNISYILCITTYLLLLPKTSFALDTVQLYWAPNNPGPGPSRQYYESAETVCALFADTAGFSFCRMESEVSCIVGTLGCDELDPNNVILKPGVGIGLDHFGFFLESNNNDSCSVGNPVFPSTGNKFQIEPVLTVAGIHDITFELFFNSTRFEKWRHTYSRSLNNTSSPEGSRYTFSSMPINAPIDDTESPGGLGAMHITSGLSSSQSAAVNISTTKFNYLSADSACTGGWNAYKSRFHYDWINTSSSNYLGGGRCEILDNTNPNRSVRKMVLNIYAFYSGRSRSLFLPKPSALPEPPELPVAYLRVTNERGNITIFEDDNGTWKNTSGSIKTAKSIFDANGLQIGYEISTEKDEIEHYDMAGRLTSITAIDGFVQSLTYTMNIESGKEILHRVTNQTSEFIEFSYETYGNDNGLRIKSIIDNTGRTWTLNFAMQGNPNASENNLTNISYPDNTIRSYHYEAANLPYHLTGLTDERGIRYATWGYTDSGQAMSSSHGINKDINSVTIDYLDDEGNGEINNGSRLITNHRKSIVSGITNDIVKTYVTHATDTGTDLTASISSPGCVNCGISDIEFEHDSQTGNLEYKIEFGIKTEYRNYDANKNVGQLIEAVDTAEQRETSYSYDARYSEKVTVKTEDSIIAGNNKKTFYQYDEFGNNTSIVINGFKPDGTAMTRTTTFQYNGPYHQLSQIDGARTDVSDIYNISYYADDEIEGSNRARMKNISAPLGISLYSNISYSDTGKIESYVDANDAKVTMDYYYGNNRLKTLRQLDVSTGDIRLSEWTYLATGEVKTITTGFDENDKTTLTLNYDDARRLTSVVDGLGNAIEYILDSEGNIEQENIRDSNNVLNKQLTQTFDNYNRLQLRTQVNETYTETWSTNGTLGKTIDGKNVTTNYSYDALYRLTQINQDVAGTSPQTANAVTLLNYDVQNNLVFVKNPVNGETLYSYDDLGNQLTRNSNDTGLTTYRYDNAGNITIIIDAKGETNRYSYDALNRLTSIVTSNTDDDYHYEYDNCQNGAGRLCKVSSKNSAQFYQYDAFGNVTNQQALQYSYDTANRLETLTYPSGIVVSYDYDNAGQIQAVSLDNHGMTTPIASNITYDPFGDINNLAYGNGLSLSQSKDTAYRNVSQIILGVFQLNYLQYDENGNFQKRNDAVSNINSVYTYDNHDRLKTAAGSFGVRMYDYDKNANRTGLLKDVNQSTNSYTPQSNRLSMNGVDTVVLDANGNTLSIGARDYTYTKQNRLFEVFDNGILKASYQYNGLGQRVKKTLYGDQASNPFAETGQYFIYDTDGKLMVETDISGNIIKEYIYLNGQLLAHYSPDSDDDGINNFEENKQGTNPVNADNDNDGVSNINEIFHYGTAINNSDTDDDGINDGDELAFNSNPLDGNINIGDINLNGEFNLGDYVLLMQFVMEIRTPSPTEQQQADINQDGKLNAQDMLLMQQVLLKIQTSWQNQSIDTLENALASIYQHFIPQPAYAGSGGSDIHYVHIDHLGTPHKVTNDIGFVVWQATYDPFGLASVDNDVDNDGVTVEMNIRFPGQYYDEESGLHYNYFRTYDPELGRYLTSDPIGLAGGINTYGYVGGDPVNWFDPYGLRYYRNGRNLGRGSVLRDGPILRPDPKPPRVDPTVRRFENQRRVEYLNRFSPRDRKSLSENMNPRQENRRDLDKALQELLPDRRLDEEFSCPAK